jgi:hypothetical protein
VASLWHFTHFIVPGSLFVRSKALAAIDGAISSWPERHSRSLAAIGAYNFVFLAVMASATAICRLACPSASWASLGVLEPLAGEKFLIPFREDKRASTIVACDVFVHLLLLQAVK